MNTSETKAVTEEMFSYSTVLLLFKNSFATLSNLSVTAQKKYNWFNYLLASSYPPECKSPDSLSE